MNTTSRRWLSPTPSAPQPQPLSPFRRPPPKRRRVLLALHPVQLINIPSILPPNPDHLLQMLRGHMLPPQLRQRQRRPDRVPDLSSIQAIVAEIFSNVDEQSALFGVREVQVSDEDGPDLPLLLASEGVEAKGDVDARDECFVDIAGSVGGELFGLLARVFLERYKRRREDRRKGYHQSIRARGGRWRRAHYALRHVRLSLGGRCRLRPAGVWLSR